MKEKNVHLYTSAGERLAAEGMNALPHPEYPRPQMRRSSYICLNGAWEISVNGGAWENILVPFPPESLLSGICRPMGDSPRLLYRRTFVLPEPPSDRRVLLHFGAVDQVAHVTLNGKPIGEHSGGYGDFSFDITDALAEENLLEVAVSDALNTHILPYGKQCEKRGGMWYTPVSGIWQTVWMEYVPETYIRSLRITPTADTLILEAEGVRKGEVILLLETGELTAPLVDGRAEIKIPDPHLWTPDDPYLYHFAVTAGEDRVESYFALRTLDICTVDGLPRLCLNGRPYFFHGLLDQGYFSDGIYTPATLSAYDDDILAMKALGFNTLRKHIKVEPEAFYYACDRLGMIVFQDMVNNGKYSFFRDTALPTIGIKRLSDRRAHADPASRAAFREGMADTVRRLYNHPSVCYWTIFNEGWGQFSSAEMYGELRGLDATRFIDTVSGWFKPISGDAVSDVDSHHVYFKPFKLKSSPKPIVLSEFGGYACALDGHRFNPYKIFGYRICRTPKDLSDALLALYEKEIVPAIEKGLCAAIYTQVSDVEDETNGILTYDRRVNKLDGQAPLPQIGGFIEA